MNWEAASGSSSDTPLPRLQGIGACADVAATPTYCPEGISVISVWRPSI
jgi:hypothetical protein